ncbi:MAG: NAD(P)-dependent oxidoreductase [Actinomycetota bacterium]
MVVADVGKDRVLVVGTGLLGDAITAEMRRAGTLVATCSRHAPAGHDSSWKPLDVTDAAACRRLCDEVRPTAVVLAHGPSSIEWCTANPAAAMAAHLTAAASIVAATDAWLLLLSTDNVFPGAREAYAEDDDTCPANAYGRAKLAAEHVVSARGNALVHRISLVYGWKRAGARETFFDRTIRTLRRGDILSAPYDQWTTPVVVADVADAVSRLIHEKPTGTLHLGGPDRVDRVTWARAIAETFCLPPTNVVAVPASETQYADRPTNSCLRSRRAQSIRALDGFAARGIRTAARDLRREEPE